MIVLGLHDCVRITMIVLGSHACVRITLEDVLGLHDRVKQVLRKGSTHFKLYTDVKTVRV